MKKSIGFGLAMTLMIAMTLGVTALAGSGSLSVLLQRLPACTPEAELLVQPDLHAACGNEDVRFSVREAIFDGYGLYLAVDVIPQRDDVVLLEWYMRDDALRPTSPAARLGVEDAGNQSVSAYCKAAGLRMLEAYVSLRLPEADSEENSVCYNRAVRNPDGSLTIVMNAVFRGDPDALCIQCASYENTLDKTDHIGRGDTPLWFEDLPLHLQQPDGAVLAEKHSGTAVMVDEAAGLCLDEIHVIRTPIGCYVDVVWSTGADTPEQIGVRDFGDYGADAALYGCELLRMDDTEVRDQPMDVFLITEQELRSGRRMHHTIWKMEPGDALPDTVTIAVCRNYWVTIAPGNDGISAERIGVCTVSLQ